MRPVASEHRRSANPGHEAASLAAWRDTLAWFATYLRGMGLPATGDGSVEEEAGGEEEVEQE